MTNQILEQLKNVCNTLNDYAYQNEGGGWRELCKACDDLYDAIEATSPNVEPNQMSNSN